MADDDIVRAVLTEPHVPGRMERVRADADGEDDAPLAVVDFAHTADAVAAALAALRRQTRGSLVAVLGAGGDRDPGKRRAMGAAAATCADVVVVTDDNPRSEDPAAIRAEVLAGARSVTTGTATDVREVGDRAAAIRAAIALAGPADTVAVLGKGHESGQEVHGTVHPFDDREELLAALTARTHPQGVPGVIPLPLREVAAITGGVLHSPTGDDVSGVVVDGPVVTDSREAGPGSLYVARVGESADGHRFAGSARDLGAVAALTTRPLEDLPCVVVPDVQDAFAALARAVLDRSPDLTVIGVTGSSGKTSTKDLLASVLARHGETVANTGSLNSEVGVPLTVTRITPTTRYLVVEMGARGVGHIDYLTRIAPPAVGVVLNVGTAHVGEFGSREAIGEAKSELVRALPATGVAVLNADDPVVAAMAQPHRRPRRGRGRDRVRRRARHRHPAGRGGPSVVHPGRRRGRGRRSGSVCTASTTWATPSRSRPSRSTVGMTVDAGRRGAGRGPSPPAAGGWRSRARRRRDRRQRRLQRQPRLDAGGAQGPRGDGRAARRTWAVLGEMLELGDDSVAEHDAIGRLAVRLDIERLVVVGEGARPIAQRRPPGGFLGAGVRVGARRRRGLRAAVPRAARPATSSW